MMPQWKRRLAAGLSALVLAALACNFFGPPPTATPVPPTATPVFTPTPLPPIAPNVIDQLPARGDEQKVDQPIVVYFDAPMDRAATERAFSITAGITGAFTWFENDIVLTFTPD